MTLKGTTIMNQTTPRYDAATTSDPFAGMTPAERQHAREASRPVTSVDEARSILAHLDDEVTRLTKRREQAVRFHDNRLDFDDRLSEASKRDIRQQAEHDLAEVEADIRKALAVSTIRAQTIRNQLTELAQQPRLSNIDPDIVDGANRFAPLVQSQLDALDDAGKARRLEAARVRGDRSELLALYMALQSHAAQQSKAVDWMNDRAGADGLMALQNALGTVAPQFRDTSLDGPLEYAQRVHSELDTLQHRISRHAAERTGDDGRDRWGLER